ncbi:MAG: hypothetical protein AAF552_01475 [Pseudomonadota bacterium]
MIRLLKVSDIVESSLFQVGLVVFWLLSATAINAQTSEPREDAPQESISLFKLEGSENTNTEGLPVTDRDVEAAATVRDDLQRQQAEVRKQTQAIYARAKAENRAFTAAEKRLLQALSLEDKRLTEQLTTSTEPSQRDESAARRQELALEIGAALGLTHTLKVMSDAALGKALEVLEDTNAPRAEVWREDAQQRLGPTQIAIYGGAQSRLDDLEAVRSWLATSTGQTISSAARGWRDRLPSKPIPVELAPARSTRYFAIASSASWGQFLFSTQGFFVHLPVVADQYGMTKRELAELWTDGIGYSRRAFEPFVAQAILPYVFGEVDDATLDNYIEFLQSTQAQRVFAQLSRSGSRTSYALLEATLLVLQDYAPALTEPDPASEPEQPPDEG